MNEEWTINPLEIEVKEKLGGGTFATVFKGAWRGTDVALKVVKQDMDTHEFAVEMNVISRLHHPNILQFLGACTARFSPQLIVMEYMPNGTLETANKRLHYSQKISIVQDIARGLAYLHNRKPDCIIHRDLKPNNVLLTASYKAKIADFGLSCLRPVSNEMYKMTSETGTYRYMAPEVLTHKEYNAKVDIWSFGVVIFFMFQGTPHEGLSTKEVVLNVGVNPHGVTFKVPRMTDEMKSVFDKCVKYDPHERTDALTLVTMCNALTGVEPPHRKLRPRLNFNCFGYDFFPGNTK